MGLRAVPERSSAPCPTSSSASIFGSGSRGGSLPQSCSEVRCRCLPAQNCGDLRNLLCRTAGQSGEGWAGKSLISQGEPCACGFTAQSAEAAAVRWKSPRLRLPTRHRPFLAADNSRSTSPLLIPEAEDRHDARHLLIPGKRASHTSVRAPEIRACCRTCWKAGRAAHRI